MLIHTRYIRLKIIDRQGEKELYSYIKGVLEYKGVEHIIVEANDIGYIINTPVTTVEKTGQKGDKIKVFTHLYVREDEMTLYGFITEDELRMFKLLISVSGVGPKAALSLISSVLPSKFGLAVITDDAKTIMKAQGIGKKTAQRIILDLKDKIRKEQLEFVDTREEQPNVLPEDATESAGAIDALVVLGYSPSKARKAVLSVFKESMNVEAVIKEALKKMAG